MGSDTDDASYKAFLISTLGGKFRIHVTRVTNPNRADKQISEAADKFFSAIASDVGRQDSQ